VVPIFHLDLMQPETSAPFDREGWVFELKYDGYRVITEAT
jgi:ATP-dependent DNA ligase